MVLLLASTLGDDSKMQKILCILSVLIVFLNSANAQRDQRDVENDEFDNILKEIGDNWLYDELDLTCVEEGFFGVPYNCSRFYRCVLFGSSYVIYNFTCPLGTIWDDNEKTCNHRNIVEQITCIDGVIPTVKQPSTVAPESCLDYDLTPDQTLLKCPSTWFRHPKYCDIILECVIEKLFDYSFYALKCPDNHTYDEEKIQCVNEIPPGCLISTTSLTGPFVKMFHFVRTDPICLEEGNFPYDLDHCVNRFIHCKRNSKGKFEAMFYGCTPPDFVFDSVDQQCKPRTEIPHCNT